MQLAQAQKTYIKALHKVHEAQLLEPEGIKVSAEVMSKLMEMQAYQEATKLASDIEAQYHFQYFEDPSTHFTLFCIFANAAEAHDHLGNKGQTRRLSKIALDYQLESSEILDLELLHLFMKQGDCQ